MSHHSWHHHTRWAGMKSLMISLIVGAMLGGAIGTAASELRTIYREMPPYFPPLTHQQILDELQKSGYTVHDYGTAI